jgi:uncharacterized protein (TIRG00374 family)
MLCGALGTVFRVLRWRLILEYDDLDIGLVRLLALYYIGIFYNMLLPGSISGDTVRAYKTTKEEGNSVKLFASVPLERISGLIALLVTGVVGFLTVYDRFAMSIQLQFLVTLGALTAILFLLISEIGQSIVVFVATRTPYIRSLDLETKIEKFAGSLRNIRDRKLFVGTLVYSMLFIAVSLLTVYFTGRALGVTVPLLYLAAVIPTTRLLTQLPLSVGGLGIREGLYVYFFGIVGISAETSVLIGLVGITIQYVFAITGGVLNFVEQ